MVKKGPKKKVKAKAEVDDDKGKASPTKKKKKAGSDEEGDEECEAACVRAKETEEGRGLGRRDGGRLGTREARAEAQAETKASHESAEGRGGRARKEEAEENGRLMSVLLLYILFPADELSLFQSMFHLALYPVAGLFALLQISFQPIQHHHTVCLTSD